MHLRVMLASTLIVAGCGTWGTRPSPPSTADIAPQRGQSEQQQAADVADCERYAERTSGSRGTETAKGAGVGAGVGALGGAAAGAAIGAATGGDVGRSAGIGAGAGAATGAATGGLYKYSRTNQAYNAAFRSCLSERGYAVSG